MNERDAMTAELGAENRPARKLAESAHRERERQTDLLLNSVPALISYIDREKRFRLNNKAYERVFGRSLGEISGRRVEEVLGAATYRVTEPWIDAALAGQKSRFENVVRDANGQERSLEISYVPDLDEAGSVKGLFVLAIDITERKRAETALREAHDTLEHRVDERTTDLHQANVTLRSEVAARQEAEAALSESNERFKDYAELASDWFWETDENLRFTYFSEEFAPGSDVRLYDLLGKTREDAIAPDQEPEFWKPHLETLAARRPFHGFTYRFGQPEADGRAVYVRISGKPMFDPDRAFVGYRGTGSNVTAEVESLEALRAATGEAERANVTKSEFLANMSHELRTPLNAVVGFSEIMKNESFGPVGNVKYREYAHDINDAGQHLLELINDILDLSKIESGNAELQEEAIVVPDLVGSVRTLVAGRAERDRVELEFVIAGDLPTLRADARKVKQILVNLLSNAIKFTEPGGRVRFECRRHLDGGHVFEIADTGIGIAAEDIPKAMAPFRQIEGAHARKHQGTGLGLPLAKSLVELHDGWLDLQSQVGVGTTVTVRFPAAREIALQPVARKLVG